MQPFHKISLIVNTKKQEAAEAALQVADFIRSRGGECVMAAAASDSRSVIDNGTDLVLVLGGDGTVLRAVRDIGGREIPVIGINLGTLGYLTEIELHDYETALDRVLRGEVHCEKRMMLEGCRVMADGRVPAGAVPLHALNDIAITRRGGLKMLRFNVYIGSRLLNSFSADGMIISTPTGSTAYNFSAGGPIVDPSAELFLLTPICPHSIFSRSIVLSPAEPVTVEISEAGKNGTYEAQASYDGENEILLTAGERIEIVKSSRSAQLLRLSDDSFFNTLRQKMGNTI